jgi:hypothetical protein
VWQQGDGPIPEDTDLLTWQIGPSLAMQTTVKGTVLVASAGIPWTEHGFSPTLGLSASGPAGSVRAEVGPAVQTGELAIAPGPLQVTLGGTHASGLGLAWADVGIHPGRLVAGGGLTWDFLADEGDLGALSGASARLGYDDGCVAGTLTAAFAPDRTLPDLGVAFALRR